MIMMVAKGLQISSTTLDEEGNRFSAENIAEIGNMEKNGDYLKNTFHETFKTSKHYWWKMHNDDLETIISKEEK